MYRDRNKNKAPPFFNCFPFSFEQTYLDDIDCDVFWPMAKWQKKVNTSKCNENNEGETGREEGARVHVCLDI